jgi:hypothetical protein
MKMENPLNMGVASFGWFSSFSRAPASRAPQALIAITERAQA